MIHPHTELRFIDECVGHGVVATRPIPGGTVVWVGDQLDRKFSPEEVDRFDAAHREVLDRYSYRDATGNYLFCWDHARFVNHSFKPNCLPTPYGVELAVRDIAVGEELTNDYGCFNLIEAFTPKFEGPARTQVRPDDLRHYHGDWDRLIQAAILRFPELDQPLGKWIRKDLRRTLTEVAAGRRAMRSIRELLFEA